MVTSKMAATNLLLLMCLISLGVGELYVDEPLLYDNFPPDFIWAAATSAYQIEGGWDADGKGVGTWDVYTLNTNNIEDGSNGQVACDSYHLYERDVEMLKSLGVSHYRFSISWPRVIPNGIGTPNPAGINYYKRLIAALKAANIEPMVTLYHWDLPQALENLGGWLNSSSADWFEEYSRLCYTEFGNDVKTWITINEPWVVAHNCYGQAACAPGTHFGPGTFTYIAGHNLILAHARAYRLYEKEFKATQGGRAGITLNINWYLPKDNRTGSAEAAETMLQFLGGWFANPIFGTGEYPEVMVNKIGEKSQLQGFSQSRLPTFTEQQKMMVRGSSDFFGLNYYTAFTAEYKQSDINDISYYGDQDSQDGQDPSWYGSGSGWLKITPFGMRKTLQWIKDRFGNPEILITENGYSDLSGNIDDLMRIYYYKHNINNVLKAIQDGVRVTAYAAWSLMDNYEWTAGYTAKFGIFSVDFDSPTRNRTAKASARYYSQIIRDNGFKAGQPCNNPDIEF